MWCLERCFSFGQEKLEIENRRFRLLRILGEGGFSTVYLVQEIGGSRQRFALKKITCHSKREVERSQQEIDLHQRLGIHPNVLALETCHIGPSKTNRAVLYQSNHHVTEATEISIILPYIKRGTLHDELMRRKIQMDHIPEDRVIRLFHGICDGVRAFHKLLPEPYVHRDLKVSNVLLDDNDTPLLMDFGSAALAVCHVNDKVQAQALQDDVSELCSMPYRPPEFFNVEVGTKLDERTDIWSLGCVLYAICFFSSPYDQVYERGDSIALAVISGNISISSNSPYSSHVHELIQCMLKVDFTERPYIEQVISMIDTIQARNKQMV